MPHMLFLKYLEKLLKVIGVIGIIYTFVVGNSLPESENVKETRYETETYSKRGRNNEYLLGARGDVYPGFIQVYTRAEAKL